MANAGSVTVEVGANLSRFESSMRQVDSRLSRLGATSSMLGRGFGTLGRNVDTAGRSIGRVTRGAFAATLSFVGLRGAVLAASGGFLGGAGLIYAMQKAVGVAINLEEQTNKIEVVFGRSSRMIASWAKTTSTGIGIARAAALEASGTFGNMLRPLGILPKQAATMSKTLVNLAGDMSSFNNASIEDTLIAIRAGLAGEVEPLRRFGVFLSETRLKAEAIRSGFVNKGFKGVLDPLVKSLAAYNLMLRDTALTQGDYKRTADSTANTIRTVKAQVSDLAGEFGKGLLPVVNRVSRALRDRFADSEFRERVRKLGRLIGEKLLAAFKDIGDWFKRNWGGIQDGFRIAGESLSFAASAAEKLAKAVREINDMTPGGMWTVLLGFLGGKALLKGAGRAGGGSIGGRLAAAGLGAAGISAGAAVPAVGAAAVISAGVNAPGASGARNYSPSRYPNLAFVLGSPVLMKQHGKRIAAMADGPTIAQSSPQALAKMEAYSSRILGGARRSERGKGAAGAGRGDPRRVTDEARAKAEAFKPITTNKPLQTDGKKDDNKGGKNGGVQELLPANLRLGLARAEVTAQTTDDIRAWKAIETWLERRIQQTRNVNRKIELLEELGRAREKLAALREKPAADSRTRLTTLGGGPFIGGEAFGIAQSFGYQAKPRDLLKDIKAQNAQMTRFVRSLNRLQRRGAPKALVEELRGMGLEGADEAQALAGANKRTFRQYVKAFKNRERLEERIQNMQVRSQSVTVNASNVTVRGLPGDRGPATYRRTGTRKGNRRAGR